MLCPTWEVHLHFAGRRLRMWPVACGNVSVYRYNSLWYRLMQRRRRHTTHHLYYHLLLLLLSAVVFIICTLILYKSRESSKSNIMMMQTTQPDYARVERKHTLDKKCSAAVDKLSSCELLLMSITIL